MSKGLRRALGILTIGGGAIGTAAILVEGLRASSVVGVLLLAGFLSLYCLGMLLGTGIIEGNNRAMRWAMYYWLIQVPQISSTVIAYHFFSGAYLVAGIADDGFDVAWGIGSLFGFSLGVGQNLLLGINLIALVVCYLLRVNIRRR